MKRVGVHFVFPSALMQAPTGVGALWGRGGPLGAWGPFGGVGACVPFKGLRAVCGRAPFAGLGAHVSARAIIGPAASRILCPKG